MAGTPSGALFQGLGPSFCITEYRREQDLRACKEASAAAYG